MYFQISSWLQCRESVKGRLGALGALGGPALFCKTGVRCCSSDWGRREAGQRIGQIWEFLKNRKYTNFAIIRIWGVRGATGNDSRDSSDSDLVLRKRYWWERGFSSASCSQTRAPATPAWPPRSASRCMDSTGIRGPPELGSLFGCWGQHREHANTCACMQHTFQ